VCTFSEDSVCSVCVVDRSMRIEHLRKHVDDLVTQRETLQFQETRLHRQYGQVLPANLAFLHERVVS